MNRREAIREELKGLVRQAGAQWPAETKTTEADVDFLFDSEPSLAVLEDTLGHYRALVGGGPR